MNYKVKVNNEAESKEVQELFFSLGGQWATCGVSYNGMVCFGDYIFLTDYNILNYGLGISKEELTIPQLKDLVVLKRNSIDDATHIRGDGKKYFHAESTDYFYQFSDDNEWLLSTWMNYQLLPQLKPIEKKEMKEYLTPQDNGKYALTKATEKRVSDWVEVPDGMNFAHKDEFNIHFTKLEMGYRDSIIVWQRHTQPEELPFADDEPKSLNDTYAEIEQVRQKSVESTLAERQSTYGDFASVANTTGQLMAVILNSKNGQTLPYAHEEALHMICSKIARIMNGDMNHKDSWHDIAGYATLIDESL